MTDLRKGLKLTIAAPAESGDIIDRFFRRGDAKHFRGDADAYRAQAEQLQAFKGMLEAKLDLVPVLEQIGDLDHIRKAAFAEGRMLREHHLRTLQLEHHIALETKVAELAAARQLSAPRPMQALPPPAVPSATVTAAQPYSPSPAPPAAIAPAPAIAGITLEDARLALEQLPDMPKAMQETLLRVMTGLIKERGNG